MVTKTAAFLMAFVFCATLAVAPARADNADAASKFVEKLGNTAITTLTGKDLEGRQREARVRTLLRSYFDIQTIGRYALASYWQDASPAQQKEYLDLFEDMIVKTYAMRFSEYSGQSFKVAGAMNSGDKDAIVSSQIIQSDGPAVNVEWRVRNKNGVMKVVDVMVEGISMSLTQRSDFASVIERGNGKIDSLLATMRLRKNGAIAEKM